MLLQVGAYEELLSIEKKMVLRRDEFIRLRSKNDGSERVLHGPSVVIPEPAEHTLEGKQRATFLDVDTAALVLNRATGQQRLVTRRPSPAARSRRRGASGARAAPASPPAPRRAPP